MKTNKTSARRVYLLITLVLILVAALFLASCEEDEGKNIVSAEALNVPDVLNVEEFDPEMKNIQKAVDDCGIMARVKYDDGSEKEIPLTFDMLEDQFKEELNKEGRHYITYTYKGQKIAFDVLVKRLPSFTVRFYNNNDELISEQTVRKGNSAVEPTEAERAVPGYTFVRWSHPFKNVNKDLEIYGVYEKAPTYYTVRFYDNANKLISEQQVEEGKAAVEPTEAERAVAGYTFVSWDKAFKKVTENLDVHGIYEKNPVYYTVRFYDNANKLISEQQVEEGKAAVEPTEAERAVAGYTFVSWDKAFDNVTSDLDVYGVYDKNIVYYTVRFYNNNNELINEQTVEEGKAAAEPSALEKIVAGYKFVGWDKAFDNVTSDLDVYGIYEKDVTYYTVRFRDNTGRVISEQQVEEGKAAVEPTEAERAIVGYTFVRWDKAFDNVTSNLDVYGLYDKLLIVAFYNCKNDLVNMQHIPVGGTAEAPSQAELFVPGYVFLNWDTELTNIQKDTVIYGVYINDNTTDTDGDGIIDYIEVELLGLDYTKVDTDGDGITDDQEDTDGDGLKNLTEIRDFLKPNNPDTDGDGLKDGEEIDVYWTLPADPDTDGDGAYDGWELKNGFDPLEYNQSFQIEATVPVGGGANVNVNVPELPGGQTNKPVLELSSDESIQNIHGVIGEAIQYNVSASASITLSSTEVAQAADPVLMYFNKATNQVETIEVSVSGNEATASITKYGSYALVDRKVFEEKGQWRDVFVNGTYTSIEVILVIDDSGSLGGDYGYNSSTGTFTGGKDPAHKRLEAARNFVDKANESVKIGIVKFDGVVDVLTEDLVVCNQAGKNTLKNYLKFTYVNSGEYNRHDIFDSRGYTYMYEGIDKALTEFSANSPDTLRVVIVFTDGEAHDTEYHSSVINKAKANNVQIYTVGLGTSSSYFTNYLMPLASETGGRFYNVANAGNLSEIYDDIKEKIDMEVDSDKDGIADFFESGVDKNGVPTLPTINGMSFVGLDKNKPDTDGDGYKDGVEIEIYKYYSDTKPNQVMIWGIVNSDPTNATSVPQAK